MEKQDTYILKKWYPGISDTWPVGTIVWKNPDTPGNYWPKNKVNIQQRGVPYSYVENSPEYWKRITYSTIDELVNELLNLSDKFIFPEYYSHTGKDMWKILNPFTNYAEEKLVLSPVEDGIEEALVQAIDILKKKHEIWKKETDL